MFEECLYFNSNALARSVSRLWTEAYKPLGLSPAHAFLLRAVLARPGIMPSELAQELHLSRSTVTRFLDSLAKRGFIIRNTVSGDGREISIFPSDQALSIKKELNLIGKQMTKKMHDCIGRDNVLETVKSIRDFQEIIDS